MKLPPLLQLAQETVTWRKLLLNRLTILLVVLLLVAVPLQVYASGNADGRIQGQVVDEDGDPVENATVKLQKIPLEGVIKSERTTTDENGEFRYENQTDVLEFRIVVEKEGYETAEHHDQSLFPGENRDITIVIHEA